MKVLPALCIRTCLWLVLAAAPAALSASELIDAARDGDRRTAVQLLERGADANARATDGSVALHWAVYHNDERLVSALLTAGADAAVINRYGAAPMTEAAVHGNPIIIRALLEAGADPDSPNAYGQTALMVAARSGNRVATGLLLEHGADVNAAEQWRGQTALMWAAARGQAPVVELLLEHGADPDRRARVNDWHAQVSAESRAMYRPAGGMTALLYAAREGCLDCARALVAAGADIDRADPEGITPLIAALDNFRFDLAAWLIEAGADIGLWDRWGRTPLYVAVDMNTLPRGGRPDQPSLDETTALEVAETLLAAGANPDAQLRLRPPYRDVGADRGTDLSLTIGATPLLRAAKAFDTDAMGLLLDHGATVDLANVNGITPMMAAAGQGSLDIDTRGRFNTRDVQRRSIAALEMLLEAGADVNAVMYDERRHVNLEPAFVPRQGQTALHAAAIWGWNDVIAYLVEHGADLSAEDANGMTPLDAALGRAGGNGRFGAEVTVQEHTAELIRELLEGGAARRSAVGD